MGFMIRLFFFVVFCFCFKATSESVHLWFFSQQEDWQMTNCIFSSLFTAFHKCWIISIGWIVFMLLSSSSGKMPGIENCTQYTQCLVISSVLFNINTVGQSSSCQSWLSLGQFLLPCKYLQAVSKFPQPRMSWTWSWRYKEPCLSWPYSKVLRERAVPFKPRVTVSFFQLCWWVLVPQLLSMK